MILGDNTKLCGRDFQVSPIVLETNSISKPRIGAHLIYSTILPRDEQHFISENHAQTKDEAEQHLVHVSRFSLSLFTQGFLDDLFEWPFSYVGNSGDHCL